MMRKPSAGLLDALGNMAHALARRKFNQGAELEHSVRSLHPTDPRRRAAEDRAMKLLDASSSLRTSGDAAKAKAAEVRAFE